MDTAQKNQMEQSNIPNNGGQSPLYEGIWLGFTPSFFGHGWEYSLSPVFEYKRSHLDAPGDIRIQPVNLFQQLRTFLQLLQGTTHAAKYLVGLLL